MQRFPRYCCGLLSLGFRVFTKNALHVFRDFPALLLRIGVGDSCRQPAIFEKSSVGAAVGASGAGETS